MKEKYSAGVEKRKEDALLDAKLRRKIESGKWRATKFGSNWQEVDFDEFCAKFAPGSVPREESGKLAFRSPGSSLEIQADVGGGYCRLVDITIQDKRRYLDINGNVIPWNYVDGNGVWHGVPKDTRQQLTHFRIKKGKNTQ